MLESTRVNQQKGFILNTRPWKESSLLLDIFSRDYGRKTLIARSARKASSDLRGILNPFLPLYFSWFGKNSLLSLYKATWVGGYPFPKGMALLGAWYLNELIFHLLPLDDPYPKIFDALADSMQQLAYHQDISSQLRQFEWLLLNELGLAPNIAFDILGEPIQEQQYYQVQFESELIPLMGTNHTTELISISGLTLRKIKEQDYRLDSTKQEAKIFFQYLLKQHLPKHQIISSEIIKQLFQAN